VRAVVGFLGTGRPGDGQGSEQRRDEFHHVGQVMVQ
jgi:hypothetical protein